MSYPAVASPIHQDPYPIKLKPDDIKKKTYEYALFTAIAR